MNRYIVGDSEVKLKSIDDSSVKLIYIDPPYNTGAKFLFNDSRKREEWAIFMRTKLIEAKRTLKRNGTIFISIDDNEYDVLKRICDEIFGEKNKLGTLITRQATRSNSKHINTIHEYILCYAKDKNHVERFETLRMNIPSYRQAIDLISRKTKRAFKNNGRESAEKILKKLLANYEEVDGFTWLRNYNLIDDSGNIFFARDLSTPGKPCELNVPEIGLKLAPLKTRGWTNSKKILELHKQNLLVFKSGRPYRKSLLVDSKDSLMSILNFYSRQGTKDLENLGLRGLFDTPKPVEMIKLFILCACRKKDMVLDYFAGSGTTGQAVLEVNKEMNLDLEFILIQIGGTIKSNDVVSTLLRENGLENDLSNIGILRLNKVIEKLGAGSFVIEN
jgi:adenine-specific DNA-methyltransferase